MEELRETTEAIEAPLRNTAFWTAVLFRGLRDEGLNRLDAASIAGVYAAAVARQDNEE